MVRERSTLPYTALYYPTLVYTSLHLPDTHRLPLTDVAAPAGTHRYQRPGRTPLGSEALLSLGRRGFPGFLGQSCHLSSGRVVREEHARRRQNG